ncbi:Zinc finger MYND domain-containing protein-like protein [Hapsidospora chrysogenum ATCC 11550]|uniref:Zinc finger MYND domain-containing protein-like protein n=1 Tax=Hapsidospora chrysogenum (strain ATCC 11550 / CBS 779.69 / DSM 880 / IAM 14645 / JCM 23072 / IMI 49137) TaxID=857340 RepID=A0A086T2B9_HAPC1|nr:Zinc finger MYND domain-containing protein-like protein [Hapsidospora chrysogenum ATCC 11550]
MPLIIRRDGVKRCAACLAIYYCGRECQVADRPEYKVPCNLIKKSRQHLQSEYEKLRDMPAGFLTPDRVFETCVGRFWCVVETRPYMRARYHLVDTLLLSHGTAGGPVDVVQEALDHLLDMLRLCHSDNMGLRQLVPALYMRLGRYQEAYDFIKWYATTGNESDYDWGNMDLPFLDVKDADVLETPPAKLAERFANPSHVSALVLLKVRVLLGLRIIQKTRVALGGTVPAEKIVDLIRAQLVSSGGGSSSILPKRSDILLASPEETTRITDALQRQIKELYDAAQETNPHFWHLLTENPDAGALQRPTEACTMGSRDEALLLVGYSYALWYETPRAVDMLRGLGKA